MTNKSPKNTDKELLLAAAGGDLVEGVDRDDITDLAEATVNAIPVAKERAWFKKRGLPVPEEYLEGYDPLDEDDDRQSWMEDKKFNAVRIISPKNAKYSE
ncbi:MAG: hypothetical protein ISR45_01560 [Rhodospirillales bacterium]|nr:hypothetical protein [Rhodospirillales bacterium]